MSEYLASRDGDTSTTNEKESYVISFNQYLDSLALNTYLNVTRNTYWDNSSNTNYSFSLSRNFDIGNIRGLSASLALSRVRWDDSDENRSISPSPSRWSKIVALCTATSVRRRQRVSYGFLL